MRDALLRAVNREELVDVGGKRKRLKRIEIIADQLAKAGCGGDLRAIADIYDRIDGKATQPLEHNATGLEELLGRLAARGA